MSSPYEITMNIMYNDTGRIDIPEFLLDEYPLIIPALYKFYLSSG